jgi:hypothetical protein
MVNAVRFVRVLGGSLLQNEFEPKRLHASYQPRPLPVVVGKGVHNRLNIRHVYDSTSPCHEPILQGEIVSALDNDYVCAPAYRINGATLSIPLQPPCRSRDNPGTKPVPVLGRLEETPR